MENKGLITLAIVAATGATFLALQTDINLGVGIATSMLFFTAGLATGFILSSKI